MIDTACDRSVRVLGERMASVPDALRRALRRSPPPLPPSVRAAKDWLVTGIGASAPPARWLAALLRREARRCARFVPLDALLHEGDAPSADVLVVFSQGLSPNAQLALAVASRFAAVVLVTACPRPTGLAPHVVVQTHESGDEADSFVRVVGPTLATLEAMRIVRDVTGGTLADFVHVPDAVGQAWRTEMPAVPGPVAFVTAGELGEEGARSARWRWLEALGQGHPPAWDVFEVAHGPFQDFVDREITLIALERESVPTDRALFDRLATMLDAQRHHLIRCRATLQGVAGFFEHDALCNALLWSTLAKRPRDLECWPGKGRDGALYDVDLPERLRR